MDPTTRSSRPATDQGDNTTQAKRPKREGEFGGRDVSADSQQQLDSAIRTIEKATQSGQMDTQTKSRLQRAMSFVGGTGRPNEGEEAKANRKST
jgi:hypothetical protein